MTKEAVVLANGRFPNTEKGKCIINEANFIVCCDGAANQLIDYGRIPDVIIGDMDSISENIKKTYLERIIHISDQETNDLTKSVNYCIEKGFENIIILGATGLRDDHTIGNISLLLEYNKLIKAIMITEFGIFSIIKSDENISCSPGQQISLFSNSNQLLLTSKGLKYEMNKMPLINWWRASLNETINNSFSVHTDPFSELILFRAF